MEDKSLPGFGELMTDPRYSFIREVFIKPAFEATEGAFLGWFIYSGPKTVEFMIGSSVATVAIATTLKIVKYIVSVRADGTADLSEISE